nr:MAG TPA: hypothetical protein [Bacteriophage sp.]
MEITYGNFYSHCRAVCCASRLPYLLTQDAAAHRASGKRSRIIHR